MKYADYISLAKQSKKYMNMPLAAGPFYNHYTSLPVLFSILDGDECWLSNVRFSNDSSEELILGDQRELRDDYIICFCENGDLLSQWRGYCPSGGASILFYMRKEMYFSVLRSDYSDTHKYEYILNRPLPVIYFTENPRPDEIKFFKDFVRTRHYKPEIKVNDIWPYVKNGSFKEELESRLVFSNSEGELDRCVRFRTLENGVKVPYVVVKCGDIGKMSGRSVTGISGWTDTMLRKRYNSHLPVFIEEGSDQDEIYKDLRKKIKKIAGNCKNEFPVICKGHLPIIRITVAPSPDQERVAEEIRRFCRSKYWLRDVYVECSKIPYISSLKNR